MAEYIAHSRNRLNQRQSLMEHMRAVADMAREFADPFGGGQIAKYLGLWHDLGKFHPSFQQYLFDAEANPKRHARGPDHKAAGALVALQQRLDPLMLVLQGHHGGLRNRADLKQWIGERRAAAEDALRTATSEVEELYPLVPLALPAFAQTPRALEFYLRMLFSALVDADFLDTERHFTPEENRRRAQGPDIGALWQRFDADHERMSRPDTSVNRARAEIYNACLSAAENPPGMFRLCVPTGGGKTLSGMAFALRHALRNNQKRVIAAVPFLTITQQTAGIYRFIFENPDDRVPAVLEHHSAAGDRVSESDEYDITDAWRRLAAQNWDAPVIVTTTVQLFESLFANGTSRCRKLHRLANSVIILDEAQTLPPKLLDPILDGLQELVAHYGATVVLSTATQPAYEAVPIFSRTSAQDIIPVPEQYFRRLQRVEYEWRTEPAATWPTVAEWLRSERQVLCIVNTKQNALDLLAALNDPGALHLSTLLCGAHRTAVIQEVKRRLETGEPCRIVTTQVVEAGVDLDFPIVLRAMAPMDSIIQAAGRANREGRLAMGHVVIFQPQEAGIPGPEYRRAIGITKKLLTEGLSDLHNPETTRRYFSELFATEDTDVKRIQESRSRLDFPQVAQDFRLIEDETMAVVVRYGKPDRQAEVEKLWQAVESRRGNIRTIMQSLQPNLVSLYDRQARKYVKEKWIQPSATLERFGLWLGDYDPVLGLTARDKSADSLII